MFHEKLKALRIRKNLTQSQMAGVFNIAQTTYSGWEKNREPEYSKLKDIANYFSVSIDYLLDNEKNVNENKLQKITRELNKEEYEKLIKLCEISFPEAYKKSTQ